MAGLYGAWKEHFCLSCTYAVFSTISTIVNIVGAILNPFAWLGAIISLLVTIAAIRFTIDLRRIRLGLVRQMV